MSRLFVFCQKDSQVELKNESFCVHVRVCVRVRASVGEQVSMCFCSSVVVCVFTSAAELCFSLTIKKRKEKKT